MMQLPVAVSEGTSGVEGSTFQGHTLAFPWQVCDLCAPSGNILYNMGMANLLQ